MANQYGSTTNSDTVARYGCPKCGAVAGVPCTVLDGRGAELRCKGATHTVRLPATA
jgi:hypothetical protein